MNNQAKCVVYSKNRHLDRITLTILVGITQALIRSEEHESISFAKELNCHIHMVTDQETVTVVDVCGFKFHAELLFDNSQTIDVTIVIPMIDIGDTDIDVIYISGLSPVLDQSEGN